MPRLCVLVALSLASCTLITDPTELEACHGDEPLCQQDRRVICEEGIRRAIRCPNGCQSGACVSDEGCNGVSGALFCDGFEDQALSAWTLSRYNGGDATRSSAGHSGGAGLSATISGPRQIGEAVAAVWGGRESGDIYLRAFYRLAEAPQHVDLLDVRRGQMGVRVVGVDDKIGVWNQITNQGDDPVAALPTGRWFCIELHVKLGDSANGSYQLFVDDQLVTTASATQRTVPAGGYESVGVGILWGQGAQGALQVSVDDVVAGTERIGCQ